MRKKLPQFERSVSGYHVTRNSKPNHWVKVTYRYHCKECGRITERKALRYSQPVAPEPCDHGGLEVFEVELKDAYMGILKARHLEMVKQAAKADAVKDHGMVAFPRFYQVLTGSWSRMERGFRPDPTSVGYIDEAQGLHEFNLTTFETEEMLWPTKEEVLKWLPPSVELLREAV